MPIESIEVRNYRLFRHIKLTKVPRLAVVIGANGSGKSTLFDIFSFLKDALTFDVATAVNRRGGFSELVSRGEKGPIGITITFRETGQRPWTYQIEIASDAGQLLVEHEQLTSALVKSKDSRPLLNMSRGKGTSFSEGLAKEDRGSDEPYFPQGEVGIVLNYPSHLALKALGQFPQFPEAVSLLRAIDGWHVSELPFIGAPPSSEAGFSEHLSSSGDNLPQVARYLFERHPERFSQILDQMKRRVPGLSSIEAKTTEDGRLILRFQDGAFKDPFVARYVSDGTMKLFAYLVLLYDPKPHSLLAVEEPENQLYPELLSELVEEFRDYARRGGQVFVTTHSPDFLNGAKLNEIFWLVKRDGFSTIRRASDSDLLKSLAKEGDLPGALWKQGLFEGAGLR